LVALACGAEAIFAFTNFVLSLIVAGVDPAYFESESAGKMHPEAD
jgi:hypothetical protein